MKCNETRELVHASLDMELRGAEKEQLESHLSRCHGCRNYEKVFVPLKKRMSMYALSVDGRAGVSVLDRFLDSADGPRSLVRRFFPLPMHRFRFPHALVLVLAVAAAAFAVMALAVPSDTVGSTAVREHGLLAAGLLPLDTSVADSASLEKWFESNAGRRLAVPEITCDGAALKGGRICRDRKAGDFLCAAYSIEGSPVTLYVLPDHGAGSSLKGACDKPRFSRRDGNTLVSWHSGTQEYLLITSFGENRAREIFDSVK